MKIYALLEGKHQGKSSSIKEVYRILTTKYYNNIIIKPFRANKIGYDVDRVIIKIEDKGKTLSIGIAGKGDKEIDIKKNLDYFKSKKCDKVFCAERTANPLETEKTWIGKWAKSEKLTPNFIVKKKYDSSETYANFFTAKEMIEKAGLKI